MSIVLTLPEHLANWVRPRVWLRVKTGDTAFLAAEPWGTQFQVVKVPAGVDNDQLLGLLPKKKPKASDPQPLVAGSFLRRDTRSLLEERGIAYIDSRGHVHLPWRHGLIHIDDAASPASKRMQPAQLGVHGVRAVQALLDQPREIQVSILAATVNLSLSRVHSLLKQLETEGLVRSSGSGPRTRRSVVDRTQLLDWLITQPTARRRERYLDVALYARTPGDVWKRVRERLGGGGVPHAFTGSAAAAALGVGPTNLPLSAVRVGPSWSLEDAARALDAETTQRGANVRLVRDTGMVGTMHPIEHEGVLLAPKPRIYIDALGERRGEDVAQHFREVSLGY